MSCLQPQTDNDRMANMEEQLFKKRMMELSDRAYTQGTYTFTDFLSIDQISMLYELEQAIKPVTFSLYGGNAACERQIARFGSVEMLGYEMDYPIQCIHVLPLLKKFSDEFTHRDFLGALMNLGVERDKIGDILVLDREAYFFCMDTIAIFIKEELKKVKHTHVQCEILDHSPVDVNYTLEEAEVIVASERIDGVLAALLKLSRSQCVELFREKKVFVNSRLMENNAHILKVGDIFSVRGYGKFIYDGILATTKKDKFRLGYRKYC